MMLYKSLSSSVFLIRTSNSGKILFFFVLFSANLFSQQNDFFPLKVGNTYSYSYYSVSKIYESLSLTEENFTNGSVHFKILLKSETDSSVVWSVQEVDTVQRYGTYHPLDTTYYNSEFSITEMHSGNHALLSRDIFGIWSFPSTLTHISFTRYSDSVQSPRILSGSYTGGSYPFTSTYTDSFGFRINEGLKLVHNSETSIMSHTYTTGYRHVELKEFTVGTDVIRKNNTDFVLFPNYPNPFNPSTTIAYELPGKEQIIIKVYDVIGREVVTLFNGEKGAGKHAVTFNSAGLPGGVYICRLISANFSKSIKMLYLK
ncbi:MAG: T9SS type A sorting domain-containing protein [Ignavibacteriales bacterium]|nr:T9SS type A sorting domain-containing protein [Ignavibacteriales bacterium]